MDRVCIQPLSSLLRTRAKITKRLIEFIKLPRENINIAVAQGEG